MTSICKVRFNYYPEETRVRKDAETLAKHGYEVDIICLNKDKVQKRQETIRGVNVYRLPVQRRRTNALTYLYEYAAFFLVALWKVNRLFFRKRYQVIEVYAIPDFLVFTTLLPKLFGTKIVLQLLDSTPHLFADKFKIGLNNIIVRILGLVEKASIRYANYVVVPCNAVKQQLVSNRSISSNHISVILNVPDEEIFGGQSVIPQENKQDHFTIITHGSLLEKYGIQTLIKAVPLLTPHIPVLKVEVVGDGEYRPNLERLVHTMGLQDYVQFTGLVSAEELSLLISKADVGVVSILISMLPNKLFEYVALGRPVVASAFPVIKEYFKDDAVMYYETGNEHDLARCILELYRDPTRRTDLSTAALATYQEYRWNTMKHKYFEIFEQLVNSRNHSPTGGEKDAQV